MIKFIKAENNLENQLYQRLVSEDGKIEMGIHPVMFGYRVVAGYTGSQFLELNWCGGDDQSQVELLYSIAKNILEQKGNFEGLPLVSEIKPFYNDKKFLALVMDQIKQPLELINLEPLHLNKQDLLKQL